MMSLRQNVKNEVTLRKIIRKVIREAYRAMSLDHMIPQERTEAEWQHVWMDFFNDARDGLGWNTLQARDYADEHYHNLRYKETLYHRAMQRLYASKTTK